MIAANPRFDNQNEMQEYDGGVVILACKQWPRSDEHALPSCTRIPIDLDNNGAPDVVATVMVRIVDLDGDGVFRRDCDGILFYPAQVELIERSTRLTFSEANWREAVRRSAAAL